MVEWNYLMSLITFPFAKYKFLVTLYDTWSEETIENLEDVAFPGEETPISSPFATVPDA